jgi:hypothetical protein
MLIGTITSPLEDIRRGMLFRPTARVSMFTDQGLVEEVVDETPPDADTSPEPENDTVNDPIDPEDPKT